MENARVLTNPLRPSATLLCKLGSIIVHVEESRSPTGHHFDQIAIEQLLADPEVSEWLASMESMSLLPVKR